MRERRTVKHEEFIFAEGLYLCYLARCPQKYKMSITKEKKQRITVHKLNLLFCWFNGNNCFEYHLKEIDIIYMICCSIYVFLCHFQYFKKNICRCLLIVINLLCLN